MSQTPPPEPKLEYPVEFPIKVFLRPGADDEQAVLDGIRACLNPGNRIEAARSLSSGGRYLCLRLQYEARDADEVGRIRAYLQDDPRVILSL